MNKLALSNSTAGTVEVEIVNGEFFFKISSDTSEFTLKFISPTQTSQVDIIGGRPKRP